ncbi:MAG: hypothetical protein ABIH83_01570 [Candidatus Micrarchaeota archaeon]
MAEDCADCGKKKSVEYDLCIKCRAKDRFKEEELLQALKITSKNKWIAVLLGLILGPAGYAYIKKYEHAFISLITLNYFLIGFILVPVHIYMLYTDAEEKVKGI